MRRLTPAPAPALLSRSAHWSCVPSGDAMFCFKYGNTSFTGFNSALFVSETLEGTTLERITGGIGRGGCATRPVHAMYLGEWSSSCEEREDLSGCTGQEHCVAGAGSIPTHGALDEEYQRQLEDAMLTIGRKEEEAAERQAAHEEELNALRAREAEAADREAVLQAELEQCWQREAAATEQQAVREVELQEQHALVAAREAAAAEQQAAHEAELQLVCARVAELETQLAAVRAANTVVTAAEEEREQEASLAGQPAAAGENGEGMKPESESEEVNVFELEDGPLRKTSAPEVSLTIDVPASSGDDKSDEGCGSPNTPMSPGSIGWARDCGDDGTWLLAETPDSTGDADTGKMIWSIHAEDLGHVFEFVCDVSTFIGRPRRPALLEKDAPVTSSGGAWDEFFRSWRQVLKFGDEGEWLLAETLEGDGDVVLVRDEDFQHVLEFVDHAEAFVETRSKAAAAAAAAKEEVDRKVHFAEPLVTGEVSPTNDASEELEETVHRFSVGLEAAQEEDAATTAPRVTDARDCAPPCEFGGRVRAALPAFTASPVRGTRAASVAVGAVTGTARQTVRKQKVVSRLRRAARGAPPRGAPSRARVEPGRPRWR